MQKYEPSAIERAWARLLRARAPDGAAVHNYYDEHETHSIAVFAAALPVEITDSPAARELLRRDLAPGGSTLVCHLAATVGLCRNPQLQTEDGEPIRTEIMLERRGTDRHVSEIVSTIAFCAIKDGWKISPGTVFPNVVHMYEPDCPLPHIMFTPIFRWGDMGKVDLEGASIYPLLAVPISEREADFVEKRGAEVLEERWETLQTDVFDWARVSVI